MSLTLAFLFSLLMAANAGLVHEPASHGAAVYGAGYGYAVPQAYSHTSFSIGTHHPPPHAYTSGYGHSLALPAYGHAVVPAYGAHGYGATSYGHGYAVAPAYGYSRLGYAGNLGYAGAAHFVGGIGLDHGYSAHYAY